MRCIVLGAGSVGLSLSSKLIARGHNVVLVDKSEANLAKVPSSLDMATLLGNASAPDILVRAGLNETDYVLAVTNNDEVNVTACFLAKLINPKTRRIARLRDISLAHRDINPEQLKDYFDLTIDPEVAGAEYVTDLLKVPGARESLEFADGRLKVLGLAVTDNSPLIGRELFSFNEFQRDFHFLVIAIVRGNKLIVPRGSDRVKAGDIIYTIAEPERTDLLVDLSGKSSSQRGRVMIWGQSGLALHVARALDQRGTAVKLIVRERDIAERLASELTRGLVLLGEGTDHNLLREENVSDADAFLAASVDEEDNILAALLARRLGAASTMALVNKSEYLPLISAIGVDVVVSSRVAAARAIFTHIHPESLIAEFSLRNFGAGFIEVPVTSSARIVGIPLRDADLPLGALVGAIVRGEQVIIPKGDDRIEAGDRVVMFVVAAALRKVETLLRQKIELFS